MQLDRDHPRPYRNERGRERASSGSDIKNQVASGDTGVFYDAAGRATIELVPAPPGAALRGHGGP
jgi:hypothetical protein